MPAELCFGNMHWSILTCLIAMVISCCAFGCTNRQGKEGVSFYRFPTNPKRREKWVAATKWAGWQPSATSRICSEHFPNGKKSDNPLSPAYIPSIFAFSTSPEIRNRIEDIARFERRQATKRRRREEHDRSVAAKALLELQQNDRADDDEPLALPLEVRPEEAENECVEEVCIATSKEDEIGHKALETECQSLREEVMLLRQKVKSQSLDEDAFRENDSKMKDFTGIPKFAVVMTIVQTLSRFLKDKTVLSPFQQVLLTCVKLKHDISMQFLSHLFAVSRSTVSRIFNDVIHVMDRRLVPALVLWPDREQLRLSMPLSFQRTFKKCACIIDCFEIFIERPKDLKARAQTYSQYKSHNTMKYLIGITPQGSISYISKGWGGRVSDKYLTNHCDFLDNLIPGDLILADRGFDIGDSVVLYNCTLKIPAFTKGKKQLDPLDVEATRALASQRIHVERVIGLVRQKYTMLQSTIPITYCMQVDQFGFTTLDKIVRVACALTNLSESVVPFD